MYYHFKIHKEKTTFWAECIELSGCVTQADSKKELKENMREVLNLYLDEPEDSKVIFPLPAKDKRGSNIAKIEVDPNIAFAFLLRRTRLQSNMTQAEAAKALDFKNIWSYQKLERGRSANPSLKTIAAIKNLFPQMDLENIFRKKAS